MRNRYLLCMLLTILMLYYALPHLSFSLENKQGIFSLAWLGLSLLVFAGNLSAWLYTPKKYRANQKIAETTRKRARSN
ncbi:MULTISPECIES: hypothetical protein [Heyndrickxia]|nr:hypothetical protein [Heyndrickxia oleronia]MCI1590134.1 hypothetical protein [Heyndrickxia oleronia]MCI1613214.1 hypothetical protein [Heyndrickxia oleronia]MCI1744541.1 hypothetical protein [Heyndrickxia oleronia]MCI1761164.1 hypothetical protein [Heyndrickxia oleronia]MEC1374029.1 hypothetical protein [Heyndrickxia oleronia]